MGVSSTDLLLAGANCLTNARGFLSPTFLPLGAQLIGLCGMVSK